MGQVFPDELVESFEVKEELGVGPTGSRFRVVERSSGVSGVFKLISSDVTATVSERLRVERDLKKLSNLSSLQLALPTSHGSAGSQLWLFRRWVEGQSLAQRIADEGALDADEARRIATQIGLAIEMLHRVGLVHRDLKPSHVIIEPTGNIVLIDTAIATTLRKGESQIIVGAPRYIAPESAAGRLVSSRADLYSFGCVMFEMLTGHPPFSVESADELLSAHQNTPAPEVPDTISTDLRDLVSQLLKKDPSRRPFSARRVLRVLDPSLTAPPPVRRTKGTILGMPTVAEANKSRPPSAPPSTAGTLTAPMDYADDDIGVDDRIQQIQLEDILETKTLMEAPPTRSASTKPPPNPRTLDAAAAEYENDFVEEERTRVFDPAQQFAQPDDATAIQSMPNFDGLPSSVPATRIADAPAFAYPPDSVDSTRTDEDDEVLIAGLEKKRPAFWLVGLALAAIALIWLLSRSCSDEKVAVPPPEEKIEDTTAAAPSKDDNPTSLNKVVEPEVTEPEPAFAEPAAQAEKQDGVEADTKIEVVEPVVKKVPEREPPIVKPERKKRTSERKTTRKPSTTSTQSAFAKARDEARAAYKARRYAAAERAYLRATRANPRNAGVFAGLGASRLQQGDAKGAASAYGRATKLSPKTANYWAALGRALQMEGRSSVARTAYRTALKLDPDNVTALKGLAR